MTDTLEQLALKIRNHPNKPFSVFDLADEFNMIQDKAVSIVEILAKRDGFFDLGHGRLMFSSDADRVAFEIFKTEAPNITFEEYHKYRDEPHILMRMSRDRDIAGRINPEKKLQELMKEKQKPRGNRVF